MFCSAQCFQWFWSWRVIDKGDSVLHVHIIDNSVIDLKHSGSGYIDPYTTIPHSI